MPFGRKYFEEIEMEQEQEDSYQTIQSIKNLRMRPRAVTQPTWNIRGDLLRFTLQMGTIHSQANYSDKTHFYEGLIPQPFRPGITNKLIIRKGVINFPSVNPAIMLLPSVIHLQAQGIQGFYDYQGLQTNRVASYGKVNQTPIQGSNPPLIDVTYENFQDNMFQIPLTTTYLVLKIQFDDYNVVNAPLAFNFLLRQDYGWRWQYPDLQNHQDEQIKPSCAKYKRVDLCVQ